MPDQRQSPYSAFNFLVEFNGQDISAGFSEVTGLSAEITMAEYRNGNDKENHVRKIPNISKVGDVTLKRGIIKSKDLWDWINLTRREGWTAQRNVIITLMDEANENPVQRWTLQNTVPIKYTGPSLNAKGGSDVAMEELVLSAEGIVYSEG
jgi:phage tail-like protein